MKEGNENVMTEAARHLTLPLRFCVPEAVSVFINVTVYVISQFHFHYFFFLLCMKKKTILHA